MYVIKRDGRRENVSFDKITSRLNKLCYGLDPIHVDAVSITMKVIQGNDAMYSENDDMLCSALHDQCITCFECCS